MGSAPTRLILGSMPSLRFTPSASRNPGLIPLDLAEFPIFCHEPTFGVRQAFGFLSAHSKFGMSTGQPVIPSSDVPIRPARPQVLQELQVGHQ